MRPPSGLYLTALSSRLTSTCSSRSPSMLASRAARRVQRDRMLLAPAARAVDDLLRPAPSGRSAGAPGISLPSSSRDTSSKWFSSRPSLSACALIDWNACTTRSLVQLTFAIEPTQHQSGRSPRAWSMASSIRARRSTRIRRAGAALPRPTHGPPARRRAIRAAGPRSACAAQSPLRAPAPSAARSRMARSRSSSEARSV